MSEQDFKRYYGQSIELLKILQEQSKEEQNDKVRQNCFKMQKLLDQMKTILQDFELNQNLNQKQMQTKRNDYDKLSNNFRQIKSRIDKNYLITEGKQEDYSQMTQQQVIQKKAANLEDQDRQMENIIDKVGKLKVVGVEINTELKQQNVIIDEIQATTDENHKLILSTTDNMKNILNNSSNCSLIIFLLIEVFVFVIILIYM